MPETKILKVDPEAPNKETIGFAAALLKKGGLVAFPTETVYGIGANFLDEKAVKRLREIKKRPENKTFTLHISSVEAVGKMGCEVSPLAEELIKRFWPGPLTIILKSKSGAVGFRMPKNTIAKDLISQSGVPVAAPSANISGEKPPAEAKEVLKALDGKIDLILDGGKTEFGRESTIVDITHFPYKILRKGAVPAPEIAEIWSDLN